MCIAAGCITRRKWSEGTKPKLESEGTKPKLEENKSDIIFILNSLIPSSAMPIITPISEHWMPK